MSSLANTLCFTTSLNMRHDVVNKKFLYTHPRSYKAKEKTIAALGRHNQ